MAISYTFDHDLDLIRTKVAGDLTVEQTFEYFKRLSSDSDCPDAAIEIVDFSDVTDFSLQYSQIRTITQQYQPTKATKHILATIFYCSSDLEYGIGRMLMVLHNMTNPQHAVSLTRSQEDLEQIIKELRSNKTPNQPL
jgi:hypothetical protein